MEEGHRGSTTPLWLGARRISHVGVPLHEVRSPQWKVLDDGFGESEAELFERADR